MNPFESFTRHLFYIDDEGNMHQIPNIEDIEDDSEDIPFTDVCCCDNCVDPCTHHCDDCCCECDDDDYQVFPAVDKIIFNEPATIVYWDDGTKTVVRCGSDETFDRYMGFCAALAKRMFGTTAEIQKVIDDHDVNLHTKLKYEEEQKIREENRNENKRKREEKEKRMRDEFEHMVRESVERLLVDEEAYKRFEQIISSQE